MDATLNWDEHINTLCKKLRQRIGVLKKVREYMEKPFPFNCTMQLYPHYLITVMLCLVIVQRPCL